MDERKRSPYRVFVFMIAAVLFGCFMVFFGPFSPDYGNDEESIRKCIAKYERTNRATAKDIEIIHTEDISLYEGEYRVVVYLDQNKEYGTIANYDMALFCMNEKGDYIFSNIMTSYYYENQIIRCYSFGESDLPNDGENIISTDAFHYRFFYSENPDLAEIRFVYDYKEAVNRQNTAIKIEECPAFVYEKIVGTTEPRISYIDYKGDSIR